MDDILKNLYAHINAKLLLARHEQTKKQLIELEDELRTVNRFFQIQLSQGKLIQ